jgi:hypothetical protein
MGIGVIARTVGERVGGWSDWVGSGDKGETGEPGDWYLAHALIPGDDSTTVTLIASSAITNNINPRPE